MSPLMALGEIWPFGLRRAILACASVAVGFPFTVAVFWFVSEFDWTAFSIALLSFADKSGENPRLTRKLESDPAVPAAAAALFPC